MSIRVLELHHCGVRVQPGKLDVMNRFYTDVLGLSPDLKRPEIPDIPGSWMFVGPEGQPTTQIHIIERDSAPPWAKSAERDPTRFHVALAVDDIQKTRDELDRLGADYWVIEQLVARGSVQIYLNDPAGNLIELHEIGKCQCDRAASRERA